MNKTNIAKQLALITGKPVESFFDGKIKNEHISTNTTTYNGSKCEDISIRHVNGAESDRSQSSNKKEESTKEIFIFEMVELQKQFTGSEIKGNKIMGGRQMTRKEYNKCIKGLSYKEIINHPLHYKLFRAEGQTEVFYTRWLDRFPGAEDAYKEQE